MILLTVLLHGYKLRPHEMALVRGLKKHGLKNTQRSKTNLSVRAQVLPAGQPAQSGFEYWYQPPPQKAFLILASQIEKIGFFHSFPGIMKWKVLWHITINAESHNDYFIGWKTQMNTHIVVTVCYSLTLHHPSPLLLVQHLSFLLRTQFSPALSRGGLCNMEMARQCSAPPISVIFQPCI